MKRIVVPTDYSECSKMAISAAVAIAEKHGGAEITLVHVVDQVLTGYYGVVELSSALEAMSKASEEQLHRFTEEVKNAHPQASIKPYLIFNAPITIITYDDDLNDTDLIVMGSHGASGVKELFVGSTAERIIRNAKCPVLVVKKDRPFSPPKKVVVVSNFDERVQFNFHEVMDLLEPYGATYHLISVITPEHFMPSEVVLKNMDSFAEENDIKNFEKHLSSHYTIESGLKDLLSKDEFDVMVMLTHGYKGLEHFIKGSITEDLANHLKIPFLTHKLPA